jgi:hypothetical protein
MCLIFCMSWRAFAAGLEATLLFSGVAAHAPGDKLWIFGSEGTLTYDFSTDEIQLGKRGETAMQTDPDSLGHGGRLDGGA